MSVLRYAVLHHTAIATPHFDLLFEWDADKSLSSFRCPAWPPTIGECLEERPDHCPIYLTFEGSLTGDRGSVTRVASGTIVHEVLASDPPTLALTLDDRTLVIVNTTDDGPAALTTWTVIATR